MLKEEPDGSVTLRPEQLSGDVSGGKSLAGAVGWPLNPTAVGAGVAARGWGGMVNGVYCPFR